MATPTGQISLSDIQSEFGGGNPIGINEYYASAGYVPTGQNVPISGAISFDDLRGKSNIKILTAPASSILYNINVRQALIDSGWDQNLPATYIIPATTYITSTTTGSPALTVSGSFPNGITIVNNGYILGRGGNGGGSGGSGGAPGGHAIYLTTNCRIDNKNTIAGGGGGGGSGQTGDNYSSGGGGGGAPFGANGGSSYYSGGSSSTISTAGIADMTLSNLPYGGYGQDRWGAPGGNGGGWGEAGISGSNAYGGRNGPGAGAKAGAFIDGYNYATLITRGTLLGEIRWSGPTSYQMTTIGVNAIVSSATNYLYHYVVANGSNPGGTDTTLVDDNYWGRLDIRKNGGANFNWYLYGINLMDNFYLGSNGFISTTGYMYTPSLNSPDASKLLFNARDLQMYRTWLSMTASTNDCFRLYYGSELYGNAGAYDTKELVFYNPANTGGMMVVLIKYGGNGQFGGYRDGGTNLVANSNGSQFYNFSSYVGAGKNVLLVGDSNGANWQAFNGYIVNSLGTIVNN